MLLYKKIITLLIWNNNNTKFCFQNIVFKKRPKNPKIQKKKYLPKTSCSVLRTHPGLVFFTKQPFKRLKADIFKLPLTEYLELLQVTKIWPTSLFWSFVFKEKLSFVTAWRYFLQWCCSRLLWELGWSGSHNLWSILLPQLHWHLVHHVNVK